MLSFKDPRDAFETGLLHPTLKAIVLELAGGVWKDLTHQDHMIMTELWRSREQTIARYAAAGLAAPPSSVHEATKDAGNAMSGCRGADVSVRNANAGYRSGRPYQEWPFLDPALCQAVADAINARWRYHDPEKYQVALFHDVDGPHLHLQVARNDGTRRRG